MSGRLEFSVPGDVVKALGPNELRRIHWGERARRVSRWRNNTWFCWKAAGEIRFAGKVRIQFTIRRGRKVDPDNALGACKAILDGLKGEDAMILDDSEQWVELAPVRQETGPEWRDLPEVYVTVEECDG